MTVNGAQVRMSSFWYQSAVYAPRHTATTAPVEPVSKTAAVEQGSKAAVYAASAAQPAESRLPEIRQGADPVEMAVRGRIQYLNEEEIEGLKKDALSANRTEKQAGEGKTPAEVMEEEECQTCESRKYQDGSDDPGVSFKTATKLSPEKAASAVRGHEYEHVVRNQAKAEREDREVVQQSVTLHNEICPECGKVYVSGGETRTVTKAASEQEAQEAQKLQDSQEPQAAAFGFEAVA